MKAKIFRCIRGGKKGWRIVGGGRDIHYLRSLKKAMADFHEKTGITDFTRFKGLAKESEMAMTLGREEGT